MEDKNLFVVILAGGQGQRLWPLSRKSYPKQLLPFQDNKSLLELTIDRIKPLSTQNNRWIVSTHDYQKIIKDQVGQHISKVLAEPATRNTAPAILLTCLEIIQNNPDATIIFLPADHYIKNEEIFLKNLKTAAQFATENNAITLLGLQPTHPATGYGYIEYQQKTTPIDSPQKIIKFHEKPSKPAAQNYCQQKNMLWNIGVFCGKATTFIDEFKTHAPHIYNDITAYLNNNGSYNSVENISIDHAIIEKSNNVYVLPVHFQWSDVGNLKTFLSLQNNHHSKHIINIESNNNLHHVTQDKVVVLIGVKDLCIIDTDDALLIMQQDEAEKVKMAIKKLKEQKLTNFL